MDSLRAMNLVRTLEETFEIQLSTKEIVSMRSRAIVRKVLVGKGVSDARSTHLCDGSGSKVQYQPGTSLLAHLQ